VPLDNPYVVALLLFALQEVSAEEQIAALLARDPAAHADLDGADGPDNFAWLVAVLREEGAERQAAALPAPDFLNAPTNVAMLLEALRGMGEREGIAALLARDPAAHVVLDDPHGIARLLDHLRDAGAEENLRALVDRLPAEGQFSLFLKRDGHEVSYRFGREPDGSPASPWDWGGLGLPCSLNEKEAARCTSRIASSRRGPRACGARKYDLGGPRAVTRRCSTRG
jgi:hypothetical protein